ncbi:MAG TPA: hypothetical protein VLT91_12320 [Rhizomicrobium sp.]|nr:hypothetical protein [Rhizomicrobium sp.]
MGALLTVAQSACATGAWHTYRDTKLGFSISYPDGWRLDPDHVYGALGPGKEIHGVAFVVDPKFTAGTNLSDDSYLAVEVLPDARTCTASLFLDDAIDKPRVKTSASGMTWSVQDGVDQGAGNAYDETVQAAIGTQPCLATRAMAHSTNIGNYDPGTVREFNRAAFNRTIDRMRESFRISPP